MFTFWEIWRPQNFILRLTDLQQIRFYQIYFLYFFLGNATELECRFVAIPEAEVQWFHNKKELVETQRIKVENQADMHMYCSIVRISNVSKKDEGTFFNINK